MELEIGFSVSGTVRGTVRLLSFEQASEMRLHACRACKIPDSYVQRSQPKLYYAKNLLSAQAKNSLVASAPVTMPKYTVVLSLPDCLSRAHPLPIQSSSVLIRCCVSRVPAYQNEKVTPVLKSIIGATS